MQCWKSPAEYGKWKVRTVQFSYLNRSFILSYINQNQEHLPGRREKKVTCILGGGGRESMARQRNVITEWNITSNKLGEMYTDFTNFIAQIVIKRKN